MTIWWCQRVPKWWGFWRFTARQATVHRQRRLTRKQPQARSPVFYGSSPQSRRSSGFGSPVSRPGRDVEKKSLVCASLFRWISMTWPCCSGMVMGPCGLQSLAPCWSQQPVSKALMIKEGRAADVDLSIQDFTLSREKAAHLLTRPNPVGLVINIASWMMLTASVVGHPSRRLRGGRGGRGGCRQLGA